MVDIYLLSQCRQAYVIMSLLLAPVHWFLGGTCVFKLHHFTFEWKGNCLSCATSFPMVSWQTDPAAITFVFQPAPRRKQICFKPFIRRDCLKCITLKTSKQFSCESAPSMRNMLLWMRNRVSLRRDFRNNSKYINIKLVTSNDWANW